MVKVVLSQDLEEVQRSRKHHGRKNQELTPQQLVRDICEVSPSVASIASDIRLQDGSAILFLCSLVTVVDGG